MVLVYHLISKDQMVMYLYRLEPINVSWHHAKLGGHRDSGSGDITAFVFHLILQNNVIKALPTLVAINIEVMKK